MLLGTPPQIEGLASPQLASSRLDGLDVQKRAALHECEFAARVFILVFLKMLVEAEYPGHFSKWSVFLQNPKAGRRSHTLHAFQHRREPFLILEALQAASASPPWISALASFLNKIIRRSYSFSTLQCWLCHSDYLFVVIACLLLSDTTSGACQA